MSDDKVDEKVEEIDGLTRELGAWVSDQATEHDVSMPFALARILYEVVTHDGGDLADCLSLVSAASKQRQN